jgi:hypothetical protein
MHKSHFLLGLLESLMSKFDNITQYYPASLMSEFDNIEA